MKERLPAERSGLTKKLMIGDRKVYLNVGEYPDGRLGEIFITIDKEGSEMRIYHCFSIAVSVALQNGIPLSELADKFIGQQMEPSGITNDKDIPMARSIVDFVFRWLNLRYDGTGRRLTEERKNEMTTYALNNGDPCGS